MCLTAIVATVLIIAAIIAIAVIGTLGGALLVVFGDLILFGAIVWGICKLIKMTKKNKKK